MGSMQDRVLIFIHIPKAAGTTVSAVVRRQFPKNTIFQIDGSRVRESIYALKNLSKQDRGEIRCLIGHMPFGLHKYLPAPATYITILRDPVDRIISHYYYVLRTPNHYLYDEVMSKRMSLSDYVRSGISSELTNGQIRLISGVETVDSVNGHGPVSADILEIAKRNLLDNFLAIGCSERFDETLILFKKLLGWRNIFYGRRNVTRGRSSKEEIPRETLEVIEQCNELDMELHEFAKVKFEELLREQGTSLQSELHTFRRLNAVFGKGYNVLRYPKLLAKKLIVHAFLTT